MRNVPPGIQTMSSMSVAMACEPKNADKDIYYYAPQRLKRMRDLGNIQQSNDPDMQRLRSTLELNPGYSLAFRLEEVTKGTRQDGVLERCLEGLRVIPRKRR